MKLLTGGFKKVTVVDNATPELTVSRSSEGVPIPVMQAGKATPFSEKPLDNSSTNNSLFISVDDQDIGDTVFVTIRAEGGRFQKHPLDLLKID